MKTKRTQFHLTEESIKVINEGVIQIDGRSARVNGLISRYDALCDAMMDDVMKKYGRFLCEVSQPCLMEECHSSGPWLAEAIKNETLNPIIFEKMKSATLVEIILLEEYVARWCGCDEPPEEWTNKDIVDLRMKAKLTQTQAADRVGVSTRTWQSYEAGTAEMSYEMWESVYLDLCDAEINSGLDWRQGPRNRGSEVSVL